MKASCVGVLVGAAMWSSSCGDRPVAGAGASRPALLYADWANQIRNKYPDLEISYESSSSGDGIKQFLEGTVDFAGTDVRPTTHVKSRKFKPAKVIEVPTAIGAIAPIYNAYNVPDTLHFSRKLLSEIFSGEITSWRDPRIRRENSRLDLPAGDIRVVHRSGDSGTSCIFVEFLSKADSHGWQPLKRSSDPWDLGCRFDWPRGSLEAGTSDQLLDLVQRTRGSIGYIEYIYPAEVKESKPDDVDWAYVTNDFGGDQRATLANIRAATRGLKSFPTSSLLEPKGGGSLEENKEVYPISALTWLIVPVPSHKQTREKLCKFMSWMLHDGQKLAEARGFVELPKDLVTESEIALRRAGVCPP